MKSSIPLLLLTVTAATPQIPRTWSQPAIDSLSVPLASAPNTPTHLSEPAYYQIPERVLYKTYPVYHPAYEPPGYLTWLKSREPEVIVFDASHLDTTEKQIAAGELVFNAPTSFAPMFFTPEDLRDPAFYKTLSMPVARDGTVPFARWTIRKKGVLELGSMGCNTCHTRVLNNGTVVPGAQGNNANDRQGARQLRKSAQLIGEEKTLQSVRHFAQQFELPWLQDDINRRARSMTLEQFIAAGEAIPPGLSARANTSMLLPPQIPDLIGVRERKYLDHTGFIHHREIADLMRYTSLAQDLFAQDRYGVLPDVPHPRPPSVRYSDPQLYALALYLYSLQPPPNPNTFGPAPRRGKKLFATQGCANCHTPPLYTNNKLTAVDGFTPPTDQALAADISPIRIGVDPRYALQSRKGTGYYKVPSLKGVWYRGPLGHSGNAATLEEWFNPHRLHPGYVPGAFKGYDGQSRSIPGHPYGLRLSAPQRRDLITFLKTL